MIVALVKKPSKLVQTLCWSASRFQLGEQTVAGERLGLKLNLEGRRTLCNKSQNLCKYEPKLRRMKWELFKDQDFEKYNMSTLVKELKTDHLESYARGTLRHTFSAACQMTSSVYSGILTGGVLSGAITNKPVLRTQRLLNARLPTPLHGRWFFSSAQNGVERPCHGCVAGRKTYCSCHPTQKAEYSFKPSSKHSPFSAFATGSGCFQFLIAAFISLASFGLMVFVLYFTRLLSTKSRLPWFVTLCHSDGDEGDAAEGPGHERKAQGVGGQGRSRELVEGLPIFRQDEEDEDTHGENEEKRDFSGEQRSRMLHNHGGVEPVERPVDNPRNDTEREGKQRAPYAGLVAKARDRSALAFLEVEEPMDKAEVVEEPKEPIDYCREEFVIDFTWRVEGPMTKEQYDEERKKEDDRRAFLAGIRAKVMDWPDERPMDNPTTEDEEHDEDEEGDPEDDEDDEGVMVERPQDDPNYEGDDESIGVAKWTNKSAGRGVKLDKIFTKTLRLSGKKGETSKGGRKQEATELANPAPYVSDDEGEFVEKPGNQTLDEEGEVVEAPGDFSHIEEGEKIERPQDRAPYWSQEETTDQSAITFRSGNINLRSDDDEVVVEAPRDFSDVEEGEILERPQDRGAYCSQEETTDQSAITLRDWNMNLRSDDEDEEEEDILITLEDEEIKASRREDEEERTKS